MSRIADAVLIASAVVALNGAAVADVAAKDLSGKPAVARAESIPPLAMRSAKVLSLLLVLESLRLAPINLDAPKG